MLLARKWDGRDVSGWHMSEKLDGVRALWDGRQLLTRSGLPVAAPAFWTRGLPRGVQLDGEIWAGRGCFQDVQSVVQTGAGDTRWRGLRLCVFDSPGPGPWESRMERARRALSRCAFAVPVPHLPAPGPEELEALVAALADRHGAEGLMLRRPGSLHEAKRSGTLLKAKRTLQGEGVVVAVSAGRGRHAGAMGSLLLRTPEGARVKVGAGFTDRQRARPPKVGSTVSFRYHETTRAGVPRHAVFGPLRGRAGTARAPRRIPAGLLLETTTWSRC